MKSIEDLRKKITAVPTLFATDADDISPEKGRDGRMDFVNGFSKEYASKDSQGEYLLRRDFNRLGELATRELFFKEAGGRHTFATRVATTSDGYPEHCVLDAFDGTMLTRVESTIKRNPVNFTDDHGLENPHKIDCPVLIKREGEPTLKTVAWRTSTKVYGVAERLFSLTLDYTRSKQLVNGSEIEEDSYVIGARDVFLVGYTEKQYFQINAYTPYGTFDEIIPSKGQSGDTPGWWPIIWIDNKGKVSIIKAPTVETLAGSTNYFFAFFAKKGSVFSGEILNIANGGEVNWTAIPIVPDTKGQEENIL